MSAPDRRAGRRDFTAMIHATSYPYISPLLLNLSGRRVLVTGAANEDGVGFATALAFARAGASFIALADVQEISPTLINQLKTAATEANRPEPLIITGKVDISNLSSVTAFQKTAFESFEGCLDIIINNAAHQEPYASILDSDPEIYWRTWEVNLHGLFNMTRAFLPMLISTPSGLCTMINVSSSGALSVRSGSSSYRTSKLATLRWTEALYAEHSREGLLAYCVNPGAIKTRMTVNEPEEVRERLPHKPEIAGDTIAWLASERREWLGGRYVSCPWDMEELMGRQEEIVEGDKLKVRMVV